MFGHRVRLLTPTGMMNVMTVQEVVSSSHSRRQNFGRWASQVFAAQSIEEDVAPARSEAERRRSSLEDVLGRPQAATSIVEDVTPRG